MIINAKTSLFAVLGDPVYHSLSPLMHNAAFSNISYDAIYLAFKVKDLGSAISGIRGLGIKGASITIPHKVSVLKFLDHIDEKALKIGAVNTIINNEGILTGYNSDGLGAISALTKKTTIKGKEVVIIGAGGAARAIGFGVKEAGGIVTIVNRSIDKGRLLATELEADFCSFNDFGKKNFQIIINTTSLGMTPDIEVTPVNKDFLKKDMIVMDIVYNPLKTRLLKDAEETGCLTIDGVSMFVYQGAFQFELWTGKKAPIDLMMETVRSALLSS